MSQGVVIVQAPAKINLSLKVLGRREDGYHLLKTHMQKVGLYDTVELAPAAAGIRLHCRGGSLPEDRSNLVYRAAELFLAWAGTQGGGGPSGVEITLHKNIPVAAGLGGGSSDAASTLLGLNAMFASGCPAAILSAMGLQLGADVPFFLDASAAVLATGIGEILQPIPPVGPCRLLLVNPGFSVSTRWVYQTFALTEEGESVNLQNSQEAVESLESVGFPMPLANDLERVTLKKFPELAQLKAEMLAQGAGGALMSGSGPTVFGVFRELQEAESAAAVFQQRFRQVYLVDPLR